MRTEDHFTMTCDSNSPGSKVLVVV